MALTGVFRKTEKGVAQMAARTIKLAPMTRMAMGPMGDDDCLAIERARTADDLSAAAGRARDGMEGIAGGRKAAVFWSQFQQHRGT